MRQHMEIQKKAKQYVFSTQGDSNLVTSLFVAAMVVIAIAVSINLFSRITLVQNLNQMAQQVAREISLEGAVNARVEQRLESLEEMYQLDTELEVRGNYYTGTRKLHLQSEFTVILTHHRQENFMGLGGDKTYVVKAAGIAEQYHKGHG